MQVWRANQNIDTVQKHRQPGWCSPPSYHPEHANEQKPRHKILKINRKDHPQTAQLLKPKGTPGHLSPLGWGEGSLPTVTLTQIWAGEWGGGNGGEEGGGGGRQVFANTVSWSFIPCDITYNGGNGKYWIAHPMGTLPSLKEGRSQGQLRLGSTRDTGISKSTLSWFLTLNVGVV